MRTLCVFNHKGGVSKTTTTFNLGWGLASLGKKVLMVDLDSQCNLTGLVMGYGMLDEEKIDAFYTSRTNLTLQPVVQSLINGVTPETFVSSEAGAFLPTQHPGLFLLPGYIGISDLDAQISLALKIASGVPAIRSLPGNLPEIFRKTAGKHSFDYLVYDLGPSVGGLNQVMLMSSDFFVVPTSPDYFCLQAVFSLEKNIRKWHEEIAAFKIQNNFDSPGYAIRNKPLFLGTIQQRYRPRHDRPAKSFQKWISAIRDAVNNSFVPALARLGCVIEQEKLQDVLNRYDSGQTGLSPYDLAHVPDFNSLIAISQQLSKPVFALSDQDIRETGKVFAHAEDTMIKSRNSFHTIFSDLAQRILALTQPSGDAR